MVPKIIDKNEREYYFGVKGLYPEDIIFIENTIKKYGAIANYRVGNTEFDSVDDFIEYCQAHKSTHFSITRSLKATEFPYFSLFIGGSLSSWAVMAPEGVEPRDLAISNQLFQEVKNCLEKRREFIPRLPWRIAIDVLILVPIFLLSAKIIHPSFPYGYAEILKFTLLSAFVNYSFAWIERRRWNRSAIIVRSRRLSRVFEKWPEIVVGAIGATASVAIVEIVKAISK